MIIGQNKAWIGNIGELVFRFGGISGGATQYKWKRYRTQLISQPGQSVHIWTESFGDFNEGWGPAWSTAASITPSIGNVTNLTEEIVLNNPSHHEHSIMNYELDFAKSKYIVQSGETGWSGMESVEVNKITPGSYNTFYWCPSDIYERVSANTHTMYGLTKYILKEIETEYVYSTNREAYPDSGNDGSYIYKYIGEVSLLNAPIFASGTCSNGYTIEVGFSPIIVIAMNNTRSHLFIAMKNSAVVIQENDVAFNSVNICTDTGFKSPLTGNFIAFG